MATTIKLKNGSGAPLAGNLVQGEPALDLTNKRLYTEDSGGSVIEVGTNPTSLTTGTFTSTGIDDNATSTAITIDSSQKVGIGTASPAVEVEVASAAPQLRLTDTDGGYCEVANVSGSLLLQADKGNSQSSSFMRFDVDGTERMRIDASGNVGIGVSAPTYKIDATTTSGGNGIKMARGADSFFEQFQSATGGIQLAASGSGAFMAFRTGTTAGTTTERMRIDAVGWVNPNANTISNPADSQGLHFGWNLSNGGGESLIVFNQGAGVTGGLVFSDNSANGTPVERMRIDSSGRVGIGTATFDNAAQVLVAKGDSSVSTSDANASGFNFTAVPDTTTGKVGIGFKTYAETASAVAALYATPVSQYRNSLTARYNADSQGGYFSIEQLVPETASVIERMRIDASGNVGIGTSSPSAGLELKKTGNTEIKLSSVGDLAQMIFTATDANGIGQLNFQDNGVNFQGGISYYHNGDSMRFHTAATERMRIDADGNVGYTGKIYSSNSLGTAGALQLYRDHATGSCYLFDSTVAPYSGPLIFGTNNAERMRIDSSGNFMVARTTISGIGTTGVGFQVQSDGTIQNRRDVDGGGAIAQFFGNAGEFRLFGDGDAQNTNNSYGAISDERLKSNIVDASSQIDDIMAVQVRSYTLNKTGDTHIGVVAQELEASGMSGLVKTDDEGMKSVKYSILYLKAIKALQEAVTRIETLEAEVAALKGE